jgi:hypothetical protein
MLVLNMILHTVSFVGTSTVKITYSELIDPTYLDERLTLLSDYSHSKISLYNAS